jgi:TRAP transporter TAXI family solute receptor
VFKLFRSKIVLVLCFVLLLSGLISACGGSSQPAQTSPDSSKSQQPSKETKSEKKGEVYRITYSTDTVGGSVHTLASGFSKVINPKASDTLNITVSSMGGAVQMGRALIDNKADLGHPSSSLLLGTLEGKEMKVNDKVYATKEEVERLRLVFMYPFGGMQFWTLEESGITTLSDLKGKKISMGAPGSIGAVQGEGILQIHGVNKEDYKQEFLSISATIDALKNKTIDAAIFLMSHPSAPLMDLSTTHKVRMLPLEKDKIPAIQEKYAAYFEKDYDPSLYENIANTEPVTGLWVNSALVTHNKVPDEVMYTFVKTLFDNLPEVHQSSFQAKTITLEGVFDRGYLPYHSGAVQYYKEKGLTVSDKFLPPEMKK